jgi:outer membrane protein assembly factor BamE
MPLPLHRATPATTTLLLVAATVALAGCETMSSIGSSISSGYSAVTSWTPTFLRPYRPDVHQGNIITKEMVDQLRNGMTREQVRFMLGTPLMTSEFHRERVDYIYYLNPRFGEIQNRRLTLYFKNNRLERFTADEMPTEEVADILILGPRALRAPQKEPALRQEPVPDISTPAPGQE